jgi:hypothetical protein
MRGHEHQKAPQGSFSATLPNVIVADDQPSVTVRGEAAKAILYGDCSAEDVARATSLLGP